MCTIGKMKKVYIYIGVEETIHFAMSHLGRGHKGLWTHRNAVGEPRMVTTQACFFKGRNVKAIFCSEGWN